MQDLQTIVNESGLEKSKAQVLLDNFSDYFKIAAEWEQKAKTIKVTDESQTADMKMARIGRLELREKRIAIEKKRKELKEQSLREGKAIDGIANVLKAVIVPIEQYLDKQEKFIQIKEQERAEAERLEREKQEEEERLRQEELTRIAQERYHEALPYKQFWTAETYGFREMTAKGFEALMTDLKARKKQYDDEQERIRKENERLQREAEERERQAEEDRKKHEAELEKERKEKERAEQERKDAEAKAEQERKEKEEAEERERKAKAEAEERERKAKAEAEEKERKAKEEQERQEQEKARNRARLDKLYALGLQFNGESLVFHDINFHHTDVMCMTDEEFDSAYAGAVKRKEAIELELADMVECPNCHHKFKV